ncbi:MAG: hypothetical protein LDL07_10780, partial [Desulfarculus sp.]|nr:hypothetical protein [Desulfarculus sp.]
LPPLAADPGAGGGLPTVRTTASFDLRPPERSFWREVLAGGFGGPNALKRLRDRQDQVWHGNVIGSLLSQAGGGALGSPLGEVRPTHHGQGLAGVLTDELLNGRPETKPLGMDEVAGFLMQVPDGQRLLGDEAFMGKLKFWVDHWNQRAAQAQALALKGLELEKEHSQNLYASAKDRVGDAAIGPLALNQMARYGYAPEGAPLLSQREAWSQAGGILNMGQEQWSPNLAGGPPPSKPATSARDQLYPGEQGRGGVGHGVIMPGAASREAYTIERTAGAKARAAGMEASANQAAQTQGHIDRRMADQRIPQAKWVTTTDPETGNQRETWTGSAEGVGLGRKPEDVGDLKAQVAKKALAAAAAGQDLGAALNPAEKALWESLGRPATADEWLRILLGVAAAQTNSGQGGGQSASPGGRIMQSTGLAPSAPKAGPVDGQTAINPQTGDRVIYKNGKFAPLGQTSSAPTQPSMLKDLGPTAAHAEPMPTRDAQPFTSSLGVALPPQAVFNEIRRLRAQGVPGQVIWKMIRNNPAVENPDQYRRAIWEQR